MCQNVPPLELHQNFLFQKLRPTWREALIALVVRLHNAGDGQIADEWLLQGLLPRTRLVEFVERMIEYGWLERVGGKLCRAGLCAPSASAAEEEHPARSAAAENLANTRALQLNARLTKIETALGLAAPAAQTPREPFTNGNHSPNKSTAVETQISAQDLTSNAQAEVASLDSLSRSIDSSPLHSKDSIRSIESTALLHIEPQTYDAKRALMDCHLTESQAARWLKELPLSTIVDAIDFLRSGGWPKSKDPATTLDSCFKGKLNISKQWLEERENARNQTSAIMSVDGGKPRAAPTEREKADAEEVNRKALTDALSLAQAATRPGGVKLPQTWHPQPGEATGT